MRFRNELDDRGQPSLFDGSHDIEDEDEVEVPESQVDRAIESTRKYLEGLGLRAVRGPDSITLEKLPEDAWGCLGHA